MKIDFTILFYSLLHQVEGQSREICHVNHPYCIRAEVWGFNSISVKRFTSCYFTGQAPKVCRYLGKINNRFPVLTPWDKVLREKPPPVGFPVLTPWDRVRRVKTPPVWDGAAGTVILAMNTSGDTDGGGATVVLAMALLETIPTLGIGIGWGRKIGHDWRGDCI